MIRASFFWLVGWVCLADGLARIVLRRPLAGLGFWRWALVRQWRLLVSDFRAVRGVVESADQSGVKIDGRWHNYGNLFYGVRLDNRAVGKTVELEVAGVQDWIRSAQIVEEEPAQEPTAPPKGGRDITPNQEAKITELAVGRKIPSDRLNLAAQILTGKTIERFSFREASGLLLLLGAEPLASERRLVRRSA